MVELTEKQTQALHITQAALVQIRCLARQPLTPTTIAAIHDLADALHNVPRWLTWRPKGLNPENVFDEELNRDLETAVGVFEREGFPMFAFPPNIQPRDVNISAYVASGARFWIPPGIANQYATSADAGSRRGGAITLALTQFFRRLFS
ncbi:MULTISPECIES: hypothetical protein [Pandoraea]|uniref:Uncharacterized protein n=2 Tax=Pandoraea TaxID=93217 RepID=A0A5E4XCT4_9BURK|nr:MULTISPECIES: hypothetical protein [Pandoraea]VVE16229.1 hypothetical protein PCE31107_02906 [Pandoraea cepalis]VVE33960.1 hypothetical protein PTE31013_03821 [Pandoraea terrigena]